MRAGFFQLTHVASRGQFPFFWYSECLFLFIITTAPLLFFGRMYFTDVADTRSSDEKTKIQSPLIGKINSFHILKFSQNLVRDSRGIIVWIGTLRL